MQIGLVSWLIRDYTDRTRELANQRLYRYDKIFSLLEIIQIRQESKLNHNISTEKTFHLKK